MSKPNLTDALTKAAQSHKSNSGSGTPSIRNVSDAPPPSRRGTKQIAGHFDPAVSQQLRQIALENNTHVQQLLREAINMLFEKYGKPPIS
jgi:hypothetical protein